jgi:hypothetical protein
MRIERRVANRFTALVVVATAAVVLDAGGDVTQARTGERVTCTSAPGKTVATAGKVRILRRPPRFDSVFYACFRGSNRLRRLGTDDGVGNATFAISGRFVAYDKLSCNSQACAGGVRVLDVRTGRDRLAEPVLSSAYELSDILVTSRGSAAWIRRPHPDTMEVRRLDATGEAVLDAGPDIVQDSLAASGSTLYWTNAGAPRSAPID